MVLNKSLQTVKFFIISVFLINSLSAQSNFEGKIKIEIDAMNEKSVLDYYKKDNSARIEITGEQKGIMIFKSDRTYMIMPENRMYMEFEGSLLDMAEKYGGGESTGEDLKDLYEGIDKYKTGDSKVIHGFRCEKYYKADESEEAEMWVTEELGKFLFMQNVKQTESLMSEIANKNFFPMLVISKDKKSGEISRFEVTEVLKTSLGEELFEAPEGYQKMTMPNMQD